jgi:hypothetical protein
MAPKQQRVDKIIVSNMSALKAKYVAADYNKVSAELNNLIKADKQRGLVTTFIALDDKQVMGNNRVTTATDPRQNKAAIDFVYKTWTPDYLLILGAVDIVPHQDMRNPIYSAGGDPDRIAYGDLPYACDHAYSTNAKDFFGPTRVVGRLPDLTGGTDPRYLMGLLRTASAYKQGDNQTYSKYFGISAEVWKGSTGLSLVNTFGNSSDQKNVPPANSNWPASYLGRLSHFINCHGSQNDPHFYGQSVQNPNNYPVSEAASYIDNKVSEGTVAAAECCYGAQLYNPALSNNQAGICSTYLANKAYAFFGSTTIAYGPSDGNDNADLICQYFLQSLLGGASIGRALLEARQEFIHNANMSDPANVKTIAQFNLYGDPSLAPVKLAHSVALTSAKGAAKTIADTGKRVERMMRRRDLFSRGLALGKSQPTISKVAAKLIGAIHAALEKTAKKHGMKPTRILTFEIKQPSVAKSMPKALVAPELLPSRVHIVFDAKKSKSERKAGKDKSREVAATQVIDITALVVEEVNGEVVTTRKIYSR